MRKILLSLVFLLIFSTLTEGVSKGFYIKAETGTIDENVVIWKNPTSNSELKTFLKEHNLKSKQITTAYKIFDEETQETHFIVNIKLNSKDEYINVYFLNETLFGYSKQYYEDNTKQAATFELYEATSNELVMDETITTSGEIISNTVVEKDEDKVSTRAALTKKQVFALKWACIFSSYIACVSVAGSVGVGVALISGPVGAITGGLAGWACRYLFQTAVEKYGGKQAACKVFSK